MPQRPLENVYGTGLRPAASWGELATHLKKTQSKPSRKPSGFAERLAELEKAATKERR